MSGPWRVARGLGLAAAAAALVAAADATMVEPFRLTTSRVPLGDGELKSRLDGALLVHLSDLHFKGMGLRERNLLEKLQALDPDLILMTGDYADTPEGIEAIPEFFGALHPAMGIYAVPGNNDYFRGREEAIFAALRAGGVRLLVNQVATVEARGGPVAIAGVDDPFFGREDLESVMSEIPEGTPAILLAHSPSILMERGRGMLFNTGDADGPWGEGTFWTDGSHFRKPNPAVRFTGEGLHRMVIQVREDGVGIEAVRLVPLSVAGRGAPVPHGLQGRGLTPPPPDPATVEIDLCAAETVNDGEGWVRLGGEDGACRLAYPEDRGRLQSFALAEPGDRVEIPFHAREGVWYRPWVLISSPDSSGLSDSLYIQFRGAVDRSGAPAFRAGEIRPGAGGPPLELILAGHTHGGQVRVPWLGPFERLGLIPGGYVSGAYTARGTPVYVSRGIGTSILPVRFACAPEIVLIGGAAGEDRT